MIQQEPGIIQEMKKKVIFWAKLSANAQKNCTKLMKLKETGELETLEREMDENLGTSG